MGVHGRYNNNSPIIKWIGKSYHENKAEYYNKCIFGAITLNIGDYILVSNADAVEQDTVSGCDIAKILHLYEFCEKVENTDPYWATVQWYSRPQCIPHKHFDNDEISIDFEREVIEEHRPYDQNVSLETIFDKCHVITGKVTDSAAELIRNEHKNSYSVFVCRYKFAKVKSSYKLIPLQPTDLNEYETLLKMKCSQSTFDLSPVLGFEKDLTSIKNLLKNYKPRPLSEQKNYLKKLGIEFINVNDLDKKVSPIKIIGRKSVVKLSSSTSKKKMLEENNINSNNLTIPKRVPTDTKRDCTQKFTSARRNLNMSLDEQVNTTENSDFLNHSIEENTITLEEYEDMQIQLGLSQNQQTTIRRQSSRLASCEKVDDFQSPSKLSKKPVSLNRPMRRKSILKSSSESTGHATPKRNIQLSNIVEKCVYGSDEAISATTPKSSRKLKYAKHESDEDESYSPKKTLRSTPARTPNKSKCTQRSDSAITMTPTQKMKLIRLGEITPTIKTRQTPSKQGHKSDMYLTRESLHVSVEPTFLPCRENEFQDIYKFLESKIQDQCGGCMYISGVPGTGKTATVTGVIRALQKEVEKDALPNFEFLEINGMRLTEPRQAYVQIYKQLTGKSVPWEQAYCFLVKRFTTPAPRRMTTVLLVDELDILCNRRQDVVYNLLDWPTKTTARLVVITIANTMDLPERLLKGKVTSRLGLTRLTFKPYTHKQLQEIVISRLCSSDTFKAEAVQLVARKVAAVSGDARRALDICRRATEIAEDTNAMNQFVDLSHVQVALNEMISSAKVKAIRSCSRLEQIFLQAIAAEASRTGVEETCFLNVYSQMEAITAFMGISTPNPGRVLKICSKLGSERLIICEHSRNDIFQKLLLNISADDIHFALRDF